MVSSHSVSSQVSSVCSPVISHGQQPLSQQPSLLSPQLRTCPSPCHLHDKTVLQSQFPVRGFPASPAYLWFLCKMHPETKFTSFVTTVISHGPPAGYQPRSAVTISSQVSSVCSRGQQTLGQQTSLFGTQPGHQPWLAVRWSAPTSHQSADKNLSVSSPSSRRHGHTEPAICIRVPRITRLPRILE